MLAREKKFKVEFQKQMLLAAEQSKAFYDSSSSSRSTVVTASISAVHQQDNVPSTSQTDIGNTNHTKTVPTIHWQLAKNVPHATNLSDSQSHASSSEETTSSQVSETSQLCNTHMPGGTNKDNLKSMVYDVDDDDDESMDTDIAHAAEKPTPLMPTPVTSSETTPLFIDNVEKKTDNLKNMTYVEQTPLIIPSTSAAGTTPPPDNVFQQIQSLISNTHTQGAPAAQARASSTPPPVEEPKRTNAVQKAVFHFQKLSVQLLALQKETHTLPQIAELTLQLIECLKYFQHEKLKPEVFALQLSTLYPRICTLNYYEQQSVLKLYYACLTGYDTLNTRIKNVLKEDATCSKIELQNAMVKNKQLFIYDVFDTYAQETLKHARRLCALIILALKELPSINSETEEDIKRKLQDLRSWHPPSEAILETIHIFQEFVVKSNAKIVDYSCDEKYTRRMLATDIYNLMDQFNGLKHFCEGCNGGTT